MATINNSKAKYSTGQNIQKSENHLSLPEVKKLGQGNNISILNPINNRRSNSVSPTDVSSINWQSRRISMVGGGGKSEYASIFRAAHFLGLFPVYGLYTSPKGGSKNNEHATSGGLEFRPGSWRLVATFLFIVAVLLLEGLGIIHMLV